MGSKTGLMKKLLIIMIILLFLFPVAYCGFIFIYDSVISENISSPHFCVDDDKNVYMVWGSDSDDDGLEDRIHFRKVDKNGDTKTDKIIIETSKPSFEPRILLDSNDNLHLLWFKIQGSFESGYLPYDADLYHKKLDLDGGEITSDKKVNSGKYRIHGFDDFSRLRMDDYDNIDITKIPSSSSKVYGKPFIEIFRKAKDFYNIDPILFAPAKITLQTKTDSVTEGDINYDLLTKSFSLDQIDRKKEIE